MISVGVVGALGRMGREVVAAVSEDQELQLTAVVDRAVREGGPAVCHPDCGLPVVEDIFLLDPAQVEVIVDFTIAAAAAADVMWALEHGVHSVVGTTGMCEADLLAIREKAESARANVLIAPNFAIGAVMMMRFSEMAAAAFDQCEIIELHHRGKRDAPSGTAIDTARRVERAMKPSAVPPSEEREVPGTRGGTVGPVNIHSVRLDGLVAHQEVVFGAKGQTLSIRHDTTDRSCFMPGVIMAVKAVGDLPGLTLGLDAIL
jgi:4-hydroxy-tetrahydrodipicolinate reductase